MNTFNYLSPNFFDQTVTEPAETNNFVQPYQ